jgi:hypothetical protein
MAVERTDDIYEYENRAFVSAVLAALGAGVVFGTLLVETGRLGFVAGLYGFEGTDFGWLFHFVNSFFAGIFFLAVITSLSAISSGLTNGESPAFPLVTTLAGLVYGAVLWAGVVAVLIPVWGSVVGIERPLPYIHRPSLWGLLLFGGVLGIGYAILFKLLERSSKRS